MFTKTKLTAEGQRGFLSSGFYFLFLVITLVSASTIETRAQEEAVCVQFLTDDQLKRIMGDSDPLWQALLKEAQKLDYTLSQKPELRFGSSE